MISSSKETTEDVARRLAGATTHAQISEMKKELTEMLEGFLNENESFCFNRNVRDKNGAEVTILVDFGVMDLEEDEYGMATVYSRENFLDPWTVGAFLDGTDIVEAAVTEALSYDFRMSWDVMDSKGIDASMPIIWGK